MIKYAESIQEKRINLHLQILQEIVNKPSGRDTK